MLIKCLPVGHLMTNCYIVTDETTLECAVIDPGDESNTILYYLEDNHLTCRAILLTHGHYDHTGAVYAVHEETGAPVYMNALDAGTAVAFDSYTFTPPEGTIFYKEGDEVKVGNLTFRVMETPGHTPGGVTLICSTRSSPATRSSPVRAAARISPAAAWRSSCSRWPRSRLCPAITRSTPATWIAPRSRPSAASTPT